MTLAEFKIEIETHYSEPLTLDNVRCILHISKRKASWMLRNGYIKCRNSGKATRQFKIYVEDLYEYINKEENDSVKTLPTGLFSSKPSKITKANNLSIFIEKSPSNFAECLENLWQDQPSLLRVNDIAELTGYSSTTVHKWISRKQLRCAITQNQLIVTKEWLIEFLVNMCRRFE